MKKQLVAIVVGLLLVQACAPQPQRLNTSHAKVNSRIQSAFQRGDVVTAFNETKRSAEQGDKFAQGLLGGLYEDGIGTPRNRHEAVKWWTKAAQQGEPISQTQLGLSYIQKGQYAEGKYWLEQSAQQGHPSAYYNLAIMYMQGNGVAPDKIKARQLFEKAAAGGHQNARNALRSLY